MFGEEKKPMEVPVCCGGSTELKFVDKTLSGNKEYHFQCKKCGKLIEKKQ